MTSFTIEGKNFGVHKICNASLKIVSNGQAFISAKLTVRIAPSMMKLKLKVCCVALAAFSFPVKSPHGTLPSSLKGVTAFLLGREEAFDVPKPVSVAYNRAARMGRRLGGHFKIERGRTREFILPIGIALQLGVVLKTKASMFSKEA
jgi:hypothetical protein